MDDQNAKKTEESQDQAQEQTTSVRRCGQIGEGDDDELSMVDVLNEEARLRADANAVLGGSDPNNCTYPKGPTKRQALYACATCTPGGNAGVCLACSYVCHEGHDLYELYTKRYFRCDCGNEKFGDSKCKLFEGKKELTASNRYNQNFKGLYCSCQRPYPDPEDSIEDQMIQCVMCEDWHHERHLKTSAPDNDDFQEMICPACMSKYSFLWAYYVQRNATKVEDADTKENVNIEEPLTANGSSPKACNGKREGKSDTEEEPPKKVTKLSQEEEGPKEDSDNCILKDLLKRDPDHPDEATFWADGWRAKLCKCSDCEAMYKDKEIEYLIDEQDTVSAYESAGNSGGDDQEEVDESAVLAGMGRVQQIEMVRGFMDLKTELNEFLQGFARDGKVVTETDIREFFERMNQKRRRNLPLPQSNCH